MPDMPKFTRSSPEIIARFAAVMDRYPEVERRKMFGYPAAFVGGNLATGLFAEHWTVRLPEAERVAALADGATPLEVMPGKPSKGTVVIPPSVVADDMAIGAWVEKALAHARSLPAKETGTPKKRG
jgi:hypothetical protein